MCLLHGEEQEAGDSSQSKIEGPFCSPQGEHCEPKQALGGMGCGQGKDRTTRAVTGT